MYESYFGFSKTPFTRDIDVKQLYLHADFQEFSHKVIYISQPDMSPKAFYNEILEQIDMTPSFFKPDSKRKVNKAMLEMYQQGRTPIVIVDEAHLLSEKMLEEVRFLVNFNLDSLSPLSLILVGQPELSEKLTNYSMRAISQRITIRYILK